MMVKRRATAAMAGAAAAAAAALAIAGCGSSGGSSSAGTASGSPGTSSGNPVKIMVFGSFTQPPFPLEQIKVAAEAAVAHVNKAGGVNGRQIDLIACDDQMSANGAAACGREAVQDQVTAVVGAFTLFGDNIMPLLEQAKIPYILPVAISDMEVSNDLSFPIMSSASPAGAGMYLLKQDGCTTVVFTATQNAQSQASFTNFALPVAKGIGIKTTFVPYATSTTDYTSVAQQIANEGSCVIFGGGAQDTAALVTALQQTGKKFTELPLSTIAFPQSTLTQLGSKANGVKVLSTFYFPSTNKPVVTQAVNEIKAINSSVPIDDTALNSYAAVLTFVQAADQVKGALTGEAVAQVLESPGTVINTGIFPPTNFSKDADFFPPAPRVAGAAFIPYVADNGSYVQDGSPIDLTKAKLGL
jgi:ABC-type branched-subunit amino acid transport system substrate-binding protein